MARFRVKDVPNTRGPRGIFQMFVRGQDGRYEWQRPEWDLRQYAVPVSPLAAVLALHLLCGGIVAIYALIAHHRLALALGDLPVTQMLFLLAGVLGIALGIGVGRRVAPSQQRPLRLYAILLAILAAYGALFPTLTLMGDLVFVGVYPVAGGLGEVGIFGLRSVLVFSLIIPPSLLIGGMLPVLASHVPDLSYPRSRVMGLLQGMFLIGAALGLLLAGQKMLIEKGYAETLGAVFKYNLVLAVAVYLFTRWLEYRKKKYGGKTNGEVIAVVLEQTNTPPNTGPLTRGMGMIFIVLIPVLVLCLLMLWQRRLGWSNPLDVSGGLVLLPSVIGCFGLGSIAGLLLVDRFRINWWVQRLLMTVSAIALMGGIVGVLLSTSAELTAGDAIAMSSCLFLTGVVLAMTIAMAQSLPLSIVAWHTTGWLLGAVIGGIAIGVMPNEVLVKQTLVTRQDAMEMDGVTKLVLALRPECKLVVVAGNRLIHGGQESVGAATPAALILNPATMGMNRDFIHTSRARFDTIYFKPLLPPDARILRDLTTGFFRTAAMRLTPQGFMLMDIETNRYDETTLKSIVKTFIEVFPYAVIWNADVDGSWYLLGGEAGLDVLSSTTVDILVNQNSTSPFPLRERDWLENFASDVVPWTDDKPLRLVPATSVRAREPLLRTFEAMAFDRKLPEPPSALPAAILARVQVIQREENEHAIARALDRIVSSGMTCMKAGHKEESLAIFEGARKVIPAAHHASLLAGASIIYGEVGRSDLAGEYLLRAETLEPENAFVKQAGATFQQMNATAKPDKSGK